MANRDFGRGGNRDRDFNEPYGRGGYYGRFSGGAEREEPWAAEPRRREAYGRGEWEEGWRGGGGEWEGGPYGGRYAGNEPYFRGGYGGGSSGAPDYGNREPGYGGAYSGREPAYRGGYTSSYYGRESGRGSAPGGGGAYAGDYVREGGPGGRYGAGYGGGYFGREPYDRFERERFDSENYGWAGGGYGAGYAGGYGSAYGRGSYGGAWGRESAGRESYFGRGPRGYRRSDERIREEVSDRLTWHPDIDASDIEVRVENGEVTLAGVVEDRRAKRLAVDIAEDVMGVEDVHNQLKVRHGFLAGLTGERAAEREVSRSSEREGAEPAATRRGTRTGATTAATAGTATGATTGGTSGGSTAEQGRRGT